jgi:hypothetical protein
VTYSEAGAWSGFLSTVRIEELLSERAGKTSDNEYFNHCQMLEANLRTGRYQYGTTHLAGLLNWFPRAWWPNKPQRSTGFFPEAYETLEADETSNLGVGGAWGAVADSFNNYWYFFPVFWLIVGGLTATAYSRGLLLGSVTWKFYNVGILCASHWFIAQSITEAFVPFMVFQSIFAGSFWYSQKTSEVKPAGGKRSRRRHAALSRPVD